MEKTMASKGSDAESVGGRSSGGYGVVSTALLHPSWRSIPHLKTFGWSELHSRRLAILERLVAEGLIASPYYADVQASDKASRRPRHTDCGPLPPPNVSSAIEALECLRRQPHPAPEQQPWWDPRWPSAALDEVEGRRVLMKRFLDLLSVHHPCSETVC